MHYESVKFPLRDPDGTVYATCGISLDVTESKKAAQALELARDAALRSGRTVRAAACTTSR